MTRLRRRALLLLTLASAVLLGLALSRVQQTPPMVQLALPATIPAGLPFRLALKADKPVWYEVRYGDQVVQTQAEGVTLEALPGAHPLTVRAADRVGNERWLERDVFGVPVWQPLLQTPERVVPGEPFRVQVAPAPAELGVEVVAVRLGGDALPHFALPHFVGPEGVVALGVVPLGSAVSEGVLEVLTRDGYGREARAERPLEVGPTATRTQTLTLNPRLEALLSADNEATEAAVLAAAYALGAQEPLWHEPFVLPAEGRLSSPYGIPRRYSATNTGYHEGTDIAAPQGTPIRASNDGVVVAAGFYPIKGGLTVIDHGAGVSSLYFHQARLHVRVGDRVARSEVIGEVGSTGLSTGPHLHWEMRVGGVSTDPLRWVARVLP